MMKCLLVFEEQFTSFWTFLDNKGKTKCMSSDYTIIYTSFFKKTPKEDKRKRNT